MAQLPGAHGVDRVNEHHDVEQQAVADSQHAGGERDERAAAAT